MSRGGVVNPITETISENKIIYVRSEIEISGIHYSREYYKNNFRKQFI